MLLLVQQEGETQTYYTQGFPVGLKDTSTDKYYINNHVHMIVDYHPMEAVEVGYLRTSINRRRLLY